MPSDALTSEQIKLLREYAEVASFEITDDHPPRALSPFIDKTTWNGIYCVSINDAGAALIATLDSQADRIREEERGAAVVLEGDLSYQPAIGLALNNKDFEDDVRVGLPLIAKNGYREDFGPVRITIRPLAATTPQPEGQKESEGNG